MKILICEYKDNLDRSLDYEIQIMKEIIPEVEIEIKTYIDEEQLKRDIADIDGLLSVFIPITKNVLESAKKLKAISLSSTGYENVDLESATKNKVYVSSIHEYCTVEVAEFAISLIFTMVKNLKYYHNQNEDKYKWKFDTITPNKRVENNILGLFGLGRIGKAVAIRAQALGMKVIAADPYIDSETAEEIGVKLVDKTYIQENADVISNHMNSTDKNKHFFNKEFFEGLKKSPYLINVSRGDTVNELDLCDALDKGLVKGAGLDVLESEAPKMEGHSLLNRDNVIITPHAAFYSVEAMESLQRISSTNLTKMMLGKLDEVFGLKNNF